MVYMLILPTYFFSAGPPLQSGFPGGSDGKGSACSARDLGSTPKSGRSSGEVFLPGEFHRQRSLAGNSPWGYIGLNTIERLTLSLQPDPSTSRYPNSRDTFIPSFEQFSLSLGYPSFFSLSLGYPSFFQMPALISAPPERLSQNFPSA